MAARMCLRIAKSDKKGSPASSHWKSERIVSVALLAALPAGYLYPGNIVDYSLAILIPPHVYWGFNGIIGDYLPKSLVGVTQGAIMILSVMTFIGLAYFNYSDVGICKAVEMLWQMKTT
ncbi:uncharacterized protein TRIADDRAFT_55207 [Trichoplax adhaerens]|uniref:Succinate dehydrogenase [ubiquinone] cytochrome b small subunit n=1 Tax=Trichoplax adhaerens TaxID=10228 RepID=B3RU98_TRIAD|nr:hypothetical protein TRIADDRAFT_55207 [Trichoplax adhaerens]EDV25775.1 hypothetical protein TRIADDRAFT_55207 [Trichoplax adhaerens]|eukprot:XP_002111808.1 hypothetical protein TRIADDRAFT_55207 [Trichoplax adhaerens]